MPFEAGEDVAADVSADGVLDENNESAGCDPDVVDPNVVEGAWVELKKFVDGGLEDRPNPFDLGISFAAWLTDGG